MDMETPALRRRFCFRTGRKPGPGRPRGIGRRWEAFAVMPQRGAVPLYEETRGSVAPGSARRDFCGNAPAGRCPALRGNVRLCSAGQRPAGAFAVMPQRGAAPLYTETRGSVAPGSARRDFCGNAPAGRCPALRGNARLCSAGQRPAGAFAVMLQRGAAPLYRKPLPAASGNCARRFWRRASVRRRAAGRRWLASPRWPGRRRPAPAGKP